MTEPTDPNTEQTETAASWERLSNKLRELMDISQELVGRGREELVQRARIQMMRVNLTQLRRVRFKLFERMGYEAFYLLRDGKLPGLVQLDKPFRMLEDLESRIRELEQRLNEQLDVLKKTVQEKREQSDRK